MVSRMACLENSRAKGVGFSEDSRQGALTSTFCVITRLNNSSLVSIRLGTYSGKSAIRDCRRSPDSAGHNNINYCFRSFNSYNPDYGRTKSSTHSWQSWSVDVQRRPRESKSSYRQSYIDRRGQEIGTKLERRLSTRNGIGGGIAEWMVCCRIVQSFFFLFFFHTCFFLFNGTKRFMTTLLYGHSTNLITVSYSRECFLVFLL